jgi:uncharacterized membrane-anchored protein YitT (DUF2179 family)
VPSFAQCVAIIIGSLLIALGINFFLMPYQIMDGGFIGISLIFHYLFGFKVGGIIILCSIPVFLVAWIQERMFPYGSLLGMLLSSFITDLLEPYSYHFLTYVALSSVSSSIIGGFFVGTGLGVMLRNKVSTGGTDLLAQYIARDFSINVGYIILIIDAVVIGLGGLLIPAESFVLSIFKITSGAMATILCTSRRRS